MQVVILAAGLGKRLAPLTHKTPKCLIEVNGTPIIINALNILTQYELKRIVIIIGHLGNKIKKRLGNNYNGVPIKYVENKIYKKTNNVYSLWLARELLNLDTILLEGDIFFEAKAVRKLFSKKIQNIALLDLAQEFTDGTMVEINNKNKINKMIPASDQGPGFNYAGKFKTVNIYTFKKNFLKKVFIPALDNFIKTKGRQAYYELIIGALIYHGHSNINAVLVNNSKWIEIDNFADLERAEILFAKPSQLYEKVDQSYGGYWKYNFVDFSYLYNIYFPVNPLYTELKLNMKQLISTYPSGQTEIINKLCNWVGIDSDCLAIGNGASELISIIKQTTLKRITITVPTFNEYYDRLENDKVNYYYHDPDSFKLDLDAFVKSVKESKSNMAVLVNPDLPSGQLLERNDLTYLLGKLTHLNAFIIDESFIGFSIAKGNNSMLQEIDKYENLVIIRSLSKDLGIPGLRLGFAASSNKIIIDELRFNIPIWNINGIAEYFLTLLPNYRSEYEESCKKVINDRKYFFKKLSNIKDIRAFSSEANYILVKLTGRQKSSKLRKHLFIHHKILIKDCSNKMGLENNKYIRLAVRKKKDIDSFIPKFIDSLEKI